jgi:hypothetical protein
MKQEKDIKYCNTILKKCIHMQRQYGDLDFCLYYGEELEQKKSGSPINIKCSQCKQ